MQKDSTTTTTTNKKTYMVHIYNSSLLQLFFLTLKCYCIPDVIMFCHGVYLLTAEKKESSSLLLQVLILICRLDFCRMIVIIST